MSAVVEPIMLRPRDAAKALSISERTLFTLTKRGDIRCKRVGRMVLYALEWLLQWRDRKDDHGQHQ